MAGVGDGQVTTEFSLWRGGPAYRLGRRSGLIQDNRKDILRQAGTLALVAWVPFLLLALLSRLLGRWEPMLFQLEVHVRWLLAVPLLFAAEQVVDDRVRSALRYLREAEVVSPPDRPRLARLEGRIERWRDSMTLELALLLLAMVAALPAVRAASGPAQLWHASVSLSLFRFLLYRWVLRWVLWAVLLGALARFDLQLIGVHPDRAGGIGILAQPTRALGVVAVALGSVLSAAWGTRMLHGVRLPELYPSMAGYVVFFLLLALAPLLLFLRPLARAKRRGLYDYGLLAQRYGRDFSDRWFGSPVESSLGSPDIQSLNDLAGGFEVVRQMRPLPFSGRVVVELAVLALLPVAPLFVAAVPVKELAVRLIGLLF